MKAFAFPMKQSALCRISMKGEKKMEKWKQTLEKLSETVTVTKLDGILIVTIGALAGMILGMLCSPRKNARYGCNNGNTMIHNWGEEMEEDVDEEDDVVSFR